MNYNKISSKFWTDEKVIKWDDDTTYLALYLLTAPHRNTEGIFRLPKQYICADLQWSMERLEEPFSKLLADDFIDYDERVSVILLTKALKYNPPQNPNQEKAAVKKLEEIPSTHLFTRFIKCAEQYTEGFAERLIERFGESLTLTQSSNSNSISNKRSDSESSPNDDQEQSGEEKKPEEENSDPKFDEDSNAFKAACYLRDRIEQNNSKAVLPEKIPKDMEDWAIELDRLNRLGPVGAKESEDKGYSWSEIRQIIDWCQDDSFWKSNILSAGKLREKIVTLENQMQNKGGNQNGKSIRSKATGTEGKCTGRNYTDY